MTGPAAAYVGAVRESFPHLVCLGIGSVREIPGTGTWSQHSYGNAVDFSCPTEHEALARLFAWTVEHAARLSVGKVIFNRRAWSHLLGAEHDYSGPHPHDDHVHVDFLPPWVGDPPGRPAEGSAGAASIRAGTRLGSLAAAVGATLVPGVGDGSSPVAGLACELRRVRAGNLYFCADASVDVRRQAQAAIARGATAVCLDGPVDLAVPQLVVGDVRLAMASMSAAFYGHPASALRLFGVTGSNGKTTTAILLQGILRAAGLNAGFIGSLAARMGDRRQGVPGTTPEAPILHRLFGQMTEAGIQAVSMEVSSHALALARVHGLRFAAAGFTNLTPDHLDFHGGMDEYFEVKSSLFARECCEAAAVNVDDAYGRRLLARLDERDLTFGQSADADVRVDKVHLSGAGSQFRLNTPWGNADVGTPLVGSFNVSNCVAAAAIALAGGLGLEAVAAGLSSVARVPGRFEKIELGQPFAVVVDFARTPEALRASLEAARLLTRPGGRVLLVTGCAGQVSDRREGPPCREHETEKRGGIGAVAAEFSDVMLIAMESPRDEDPDRIAGDILRGWQARAAARPVISVGVADIVHDRAKAIARAVALARAGDVVLISGRGVESFQTILRHRVRFDDARAAQRALRESGWGTVDELA